MTRESATRDDADLSLMTMLEVRAELERLDRRRRLLLRIMRFHRELAETNGRGGKRGDDDDEG